MTIDGMTHWTKVGVRHAHEDPGKFLSVPYVVHPAMMFPSHQTVFTSALCVLCGSPSYFSSEGLMVNLQLLYMPAIVPR